MARKGTRAPLRARVDPARRRLFLRLVVPVVAAAVYLGFRAERREAQITELNRIHRTPSETITNQVRESMKSVIEITTKLRTGGADNGTRRLWASAYDKALERLFAALTTLPDVHVFPIDADDELFRTEPLSAYDAAAVIFSLRQVSRFTVETFGLSALRSALECGTDDPDGALACFHGSDDSKGVVYVAGGASVLPLAVASIEHLRASGCTLPIELFMLPIEAPTIAMRTKLTALNVHIRIIHEGLYAMFNAEDAAAPGTVSLYALKAIALVQTRFSQVLYLDADNFVARDPTFLLESVELTTAPAILWPDYWPFDRDAPLYKRALRLPKSYRSQESGQMVFDRRRPRVIAALLCAALMNMRRAVLYHHIFGKATNGIGDKETFQLALFIFGIPYSMMPSAGFVGIPSNRFGPIESVALGQRDRDGNLLFVHANANKWNALHYARTGVLQGAPWQRVAFLADERDAQQPDTVSIHDGQSFRQRWVNTVEKKPLKLMTLPEAAGSDVYAKVLATIGTVFSSDAVKEYLHAQKTCPLRRLRSGVWSVPLAPTGKVQKRKRILIRVLVLRSVAHFRSLHPLEAPFRHGTLQPRNAADAEPSCLSATTLAEDDVSSGRQLLQLSYRAHNGETHEHTVTLNDAGTSLLVPSLAQEWTFVR